MGGDYADDRVGAWANGLERIKLRISQRFPRKGAKGAKKTRISSLPGDHEEADGLAFLFCFVFNLSFTTATQFLIDTKSACL